MNILRKNLTMMGAPLLLLSSVAFATPPTPVTPHRAIATLPAGPHRLSVTDNTHIGIGVYPNTEAGKAACFAALDAGTAVFYRPTDTRHFDASLPHRPLEAATCGQLVVAINRGSVGIVAFREGTEFNTSTAPDGRILLSALRECNNWVNLFYREVGRPVQPPQTSVVQTEIRPTTVRAPDVQPQIERPIPHNQVVEYDAGTITYVPRYRVVVAPPQVEEVVAQPVFRAPVQTYVEMEVEQHCVCLENPYDEVMREIDVTRTWRGLRPGFYCMPNSMALQYYNLRAWSN